MTTTSARYPAVTDPRLGRHFSFDSRNLRFVSELTPTYVDVRWPRHVPIYDQDVPKPRGSCTGQAIAGACATSPLWEALSDALRATLMNDDQAMKFYSEATATDPFPGVFNWQNPDGPGSVDTGSDGTDACKAASRDRYISSYQHALSFTTALAALEKGPVISGINWYKGMFTPDENGLVTIAPGDTIAGGHEMCFDEIIVAKQLVGFQQSWGNWGVQGRGYMSWDTWGRLLSENGDVNVPQPLNVTKPPPAPVPAVDPDALAAYQALKRWAARNGVL